MDEEKELSDKHKLFIAEYVACNCNATRAYCNVYGVNEESGRREGSRLLSNVDIKGAIDKEIERVLKELTELPCLKMRKITETCSKWITSSFSRILRGLIRCPLGLKALLRLSFVLIFQSFPTIHQGFGFRNGPLHK